MRQTVKFSAGGVLLMAALAVALLTEGEQTPSRVFVVNTQDASVSLVDLKAMKEIRRFTVGQGLYGIAVRPDGKTVAVGVETDNYFRVLQDP